MTLTTSGTQVHVRHDAIEDVVGRGPSPVVHDQTLTLLESRFAAEYAVAAGWGLRLTLPYRLMSTRIHYVDASGASVPLSFPEVHHVNETRVGLGDVALEVEHALRAGATRLSVRAGLALPTGLTEADPFRLGDLGLPHEHFQMGTGLISPLLGGDLTRALPGWSLGGYGATQLMLYENAKGYQPGHRFGAGLFATSALGTRRWRFRVSADLEIARADRWHGLVHSDEGNQGRSDVMAGGGVSLALGGGVRLDAALRVPLYTHVIGGQLSYPAIGELGISAQFGGRAARSPAAAPAAPADWSGLDLASLTDRGEAVAIAPVPGKVTLVDFWARWCQPCKLLDAALAALARRHPGQVAVRKVNVVDWDHPAARTYLIPYGFNLPHLEVYDRRGTRVLAESGEPAVLARAAEAIAWPPGRRVDILVSASGYQPSRIPARPGEALALVFLRRVEAGCADDVSVPLSAPAIALPLGQAVSIPVTAPLTGTLRFGCGMQMFVGDVVVSP